MEEQLLKQLETALAGVVGKFKEDLRGIRSNRPSVELIENIPVSCYDQMFTVKQLGSISVSPPRELVVSVWDRTSAPAVAKAIEDAHVGLSVSSDGQLIRAALSPLGNERREELTKLVKRIGEECRIAIRANRDDILKQGKAGNLTEDSQFRLKEKVQKTVDRMNGEVEQSVAGKLSELGE